MFDLYPLVEPLHQIIIIVALAPLCLLLSYAARMYAGKRAK